MRSFDLQLIYRIRMFLYFIFIFSAFNCVYSWSAMALDLRDFTERYRGTAVFVAVTSPTETEPFATASGVVLPAGYVLTSLHILKDGNGILDEEAINTWKIRGFRSVRSSENAVDLAVVDYDKGHDLLLLRMDPDTARGKPAACIRTTVVQVGEELIVLGFPLGGPLAPTSGVVMSLTENEILTDTTVAKGSSGSPVFDTAGNLVGIVRGERTQGIEGSDIYVLVPISRASRLLSNVETDPDGPCERSAVPVVFVPFFDSNGPLPGTDHVLRSRPPFFDKGFVLQSGATLRGGLQFKGRTNEKVTVSQISIEVTAFQPDPIFALDYDYGPSNVKGRGIADALAYRMLFRGTQQPRVSRMTATHEFRDVSASDLLEGVKVTLNSEDPFEPLTLTIATRDIGYQEFVLKALVFSSSRAQLITSDSIRFYFNEH